MLFHYMHKSDILIGPTLLSHCGYVEFSISLSTSSIVSEVLLWHVAMLFIDKLATFENHAERSSMLGAWTPTFMVLNPTLPNPKGCQQKFLEEGRSPFAPSIQVMEAVRKYEQLFLKSKTSVAVMNISYAQWEN